MSGSINQFQAPVAVQTDTTIRITETRQDNETQSDKKHLFFKLNDRFCVSLSVFSAMVLTVPTHSYLLLHLPVAGCKQETYSVSLLSKAFRSETKMRTLKHIVFGLNITAA